jgi:hypothetical protein
LHVRDDQVLVAVAVEVRGFDLARFVVAYRQAARGGVDEQAVAVVQEQLVLALVADQHVLIAVAVDIGELEVLRARRTPLRPAAERLVAECCAAVVEQSEVGVDVAGEHVLRAVVVEIEDRERVRDRLAGV